MQVLSNDSLDALVEAARADPRRRMGRDLHGSPSDAVCRRAVAIEPDAFVRPHRHRDRWELLLAVRGACDVLIFDVQGTVTDRFLLAPGTGMAAIEIDPGTVHSLVARESGSVFFEVKQGPYSPQTGAEIAPWAPDEEDEGARMFLDRMRYALPGSRLA
ncbi:MAG: WbuC family cupin fold metalloprotein [Burkholderiaceae bacterium]